MTSPAIPPLQIPDAVLRRARSLGASGRNWLITVPSLLQSLCDDWSLQFGEVLTGGSESLTATVTRQDMRSAVLKIGMPGSADLAREARVYQLADGKGYARCFRHDETRNAILLERLGDPIGTANLSTDTQISAICETLVSSWIQVNDTFGLLPGNQKAQWLADQVKKQWHQQGQPCSKAVIDRAVTFAVERARAHDLAGSVLVHGDAHEMNTLAVSAGDSVKYKFIDPDGLYAEPACDLAVLMRGWNEELLIGDTKILLQARCEKLAQWSGVEAEPIWQWGYVERVSTGLHLLELGFSDEGAQFLAVAERV